MHTRPRHIGLGLLALAILALPLTAATTTAAGFTEDFASAAPGSVPDGFLVLDGRFAVREEAGEKFLELPGSPLETFGVMFGPAGKEDWGAQARFQGTSRGRRFPAFGISINGVGGYRVMVAPAKRALEILKGDVVKASVPFSWKSGTWTQVRVQIRKTGDDTWQIAGKAWEASQPEPTDWLITWDETQTPINGRAAVWGKPFAGTPIRFDDLQLLPVD